MARDKSTDGIFLNNFFKDRLEVFTKDQPRNEKEYLHLYGLANLEWLPLNEELETYNLSFDIKKELKNLFLFASDYYVYLIIDDPSLNAKKRDLWPKMQKTAIHIRNAAKTQRLYFD